jgi:hypothetical protein
MTYDRALAQQKFDGCKIVKAVRLADRYECTRKDGAVIYMSIYCGQKFFPLALVGAAE